MPWFVREAGLHGALIHFGILVGVFFIIWDIRKDKKINLEGDVIPLILVGIIAAIAFLSLILR